MKNAATIAIGLATLTSLFATQPGAAQTLRPDQQAFRALYKEMVETDTSITTALTVHAVGKPAWVASEPKTIGPAKPPA